MGARSGGSAGGGSAKWTLGSLGEDAGGSLGDEAGERCSLVEGGESAGNWSVIGEIMSGGFRGCRSGTAGLANGDTGGVGVGAGE